MYEYQQLLSNILKNGIRKSNRTGIDTISLFGTMLKFDLAKGFPLLTTKKVHFKSIVHELLWFLRGDSNIAYLRDNGVNIWNEWADSAGELGPVYGVQWRKWFSLDWVEKNVFPYEEPKIITGLIKPECDYSSNKNNLIGQIFKNTYGEFQVIKEYRLEEKDRTNGHWAFDVCFLATNFIAKKVKKNKILNGTIKDKFYPSVSGVACIGEYQEDEFHDKLYPIWVDIIRRCYDSNTASYSMYGAKGIFVDNRWLNYSNFLNDVKCIPNWHLKRVFWSKYSLDKDIKASNKYSRETCVWANQLEQSYNTSRTRCFKAISPDGEESVWCGVKFFADRYGFSETTIIGCLNGDYEKNFGWRFVPIEPSDKVLRIKIIDQIEEAIALIKTDPNSRRIVVTAWNPSEISKMKLPPCHYNFCFNVEDNKLNCSFSMRSIDTFLGLPFNIASYALLTHLVAQVCGLEPGTLVFFGGDTHIYSNHLEQVKIQLSRESKILPKLIVDKSILDIDDFRYHHISLEGYDPHPAIKAEVAV